MADRRYPLEAARTLREEEEATRLRELVRATQAQEHAADALRRADEAWRAHEAETARTAGEEAARDAAGRTVDEVLRGRAFLARRKSEAAALARAVETERAREKEASRALEAARTALAEARAAKEAVERHHAAWRDEQRDAEHRREDDEADERAIRGAGPAEHRNRVPRGGREEA
jgi:hypothetical protein